MSDLVRFRDHARRMAQPGSHRVDCATQAGTVAALRARCGGCVTDADRALWRRLAEETDRYLERNTDVELDLIT